MRITSSRLNNQGFSLIEILISLLIISGGCLALTKFQALILNSNAQLKQSNEAVAIAEATIEQLKDSSKSLAANNVATTYKTTLDAITWGNVQGKTSLFSRAVTTSYAVTANRYPLAATVHVYWDCTYNPVDLTDCKQKGHFVELINYFAPISLNAT